jgi:hypothetical protein
MEYLHFVTYQTTKKFYIFDLEEVELLRKIAVILLTKLSPEEVKNHLHKFLKFV